MSIAIQRRRGTTSEHSAFTGMLGETTVDTTKKTVVVHDGITAGGSPLVTEKNPTTSGTLTHTGNATVSGIVGIGRDVAANHRAIVQGIGSSSSTYCARFQNGADIDILRLFDDRSIELNGPAYMTAPYSLGYGTGAGGTVMQPTSKGTTVTLNKPCGQITMSNAALAANTDVFFTMNNSLVSTTDVVVVHAAGPGNGDDYDVAVYAVGTGSASFRVKNRSGVSLSDALVLSFAIIKGTVS